MGGKGDPQCATKYCCQPKAQMSGVTFHFVFNTLWGSKKVLYAEGCYEVSVSLISKIYFKKHLASFFLITQDETSNYDRSGDLNTGRVQYSNVRKQDVGQTFQNSNQIWIPDSLTIWIITKWLPSWVLPIEKPT